MNNVSEQEGILSNRYSNPPADKFLTGANSKALKHLCEGIKPETLRDSALRQTFRLHIFLIDVRIQRVQDIEVKSLFYGDDCTCVPAITAGISE